MMDKIKIVIIITLIVLLIIIFFPKKKSQENEFKFDGKKSGIYLIGNLVEYIDIKDDYIEKGAIAKDSEGRNISENIITNYYQGNKQIFEINTMYAGTYTVKYHIKEKDKTYEATRVVIVNDKEPPTISDIKAKTITVNEVKSINLEEDIVAKDDSGKVIVKCDNNIKQQPGEYVVTCKATDKYGNQKSIKRLIKVI